MKKFNMSFFKVKKEICVEIGDVKFCIISDKACDESMKEKMAIILNFVGEYGFEWEHIFELVHVPDTATLTLKHEIYFVLSRYNLRIQNIWWQLRNDSANNMQDG